MNSWLSRCDTTRGPDPGFARGGPTKIGACTSILLTGSCKNDKSYYICIGQQQYHVVPMCTYEI